MSSDRQRQLRWRLVLGEGTEDVLGCTMEGEWASRDRALGFLPRGAEGSARSRRGGVHPRRAAGRGGPGRCGGAHARAPVSACSSAERSGDVSAMYSARRSMSSAGFTPTLRTE